MKKPSFEKYANNYDEWFLKNENVLKSEVELVAKALEEPGKTLSVGCGSGLFETILKDEFGIKISNGIEPSEGMAEIAKQRGLEVKIGTAENTDFGVNEFDTLLFNGTPSYISDLEKAFTKALQALKPDGKIVVIDVPKESSYALIYNLAKTVGSWEDSNISDVKPKNPYPIEFVKDANWRTTKEKIETLEKVGFKDFKYYQTLTQHPVYSNESVEAPSEGFTRGDYVAIIAQKK